MLDYFNGELTPSNVLFFPTINEIYYKSIIDWDEYYESMTVMEVRTSNNFEQISKMEFYIFRAKVKYLNKYIEDENKAQSGDSDNDMLTKQQEASNSMMRNAQNSMKNLNTKPNIPKLK